SMDNRRKFLAAASMASDRAIDALRHDLPRDRRSKDVLVATSLLTLAALAPYGLAVTMPRTLTAALSESTFEWLPLSILLAVIGTFFVTKIWKLIQDSRVEKSSITSRRSARIYSSIYSHRIVVAAALVGLAIALFNLKEAYVVQRDVFDSQKEV